MSNTMKPAVHTVTFGWQLKFAVDEGNLKSHPQQKWIGLLATRHRPSPVV